MTLQGLPKWMRWAFFALAPLALLAGLLLQAYNTRRDPSLLRVESNRERAIAAAREYLATLGLNVTSWKAYCAAIPNVDLFRYLRSRGLDRGMVQHIAPPVRVQVLFESNSQRRALVTLSMEDRVLGFNVRAAGLETPATELSDEQSLAVARQVLRSQPRLAEVFGEAREEVATADRSENAVTRIYTWRTPLRQARELELVFTTSVRNGNILGRSLDANVDPDYLKHTFGAADTVTSLFSISYVFFGLVIILYSLITYARRATQREVSHSRTLWMALILFVLFMSVVGVGSYDSVRIQLASQGATVPLAFIYTLFTLCVIGAAILAGIAYGGGEGDVREAYPGKLTSLDALIVGKVFSTNVGASVIVGAAFACWFLLLSQSLKSLATAQASLESLNSAGWAYMKAAWISFLTVTPAVVFLFAIAGLLQPLAFGVRHVRNFRMRLAVVVLCCIAAATGSVTAKPALATLLISITISVCALLVPFFAYDFLAALVCVIALSFLTSLIHVATLYQGWETFVFSLGGVALLTLAVELFAWRRGRKYGEEEVRPEYARHIAERQSLEAEVSAAREAQLRLLPHEPPTIPGLSIAAACLPARVVGGDFYDFFPLTDGRLGIFIAEGGNKGLASALSIALAKGYLMHAVSRTASPTEMIVRLEGALGAILEDGVVPATLAYLVIDRRRGLLHYARTGAYPKVIVTAAAQTEREVARTPGRNLTLWEGQASFHCGDSVVLYTDGVARRIGRRTAMLEEDWIRRLAQDGHDAPQLHASLFDSIGAYSKDDEAEDDLTALVIACREIAARRLEGVA